MRLAVLLLVSVALLTQLPRLADLGDFAGDKVVESLQSSTTTTYESCKALHKDYPNGVGTQAAVEALGQRRRLPAADPDVYAANTALDKDRDRLACERRP